MMTDQNPLCIMREGLFLYINGDYVAIYKNKKNGYNKR